jgi:hypothetical protein
VVVNFYYSPQSDLNLNDVLTSCGRCVLHSYDGTNFGYGHGMIFNRFLLVIVGVGYCTNKKGKPKEATAHKELKNENPLMRSLVAACQA